MRSAISLAAGAALFLACMVFGSAARGAQRGGRGSVGQGGAAQGARGGNTQSFPAQQRPPGDPALIANGNMLYGIHCRACHGADLRGGDQGGPNLLRSQLVLNDQSGELILPVVQEGRRNPGMGVMPALTLSPDDVKAVAEYIHSVAATSQRQGGPPSVPPVVLNVLVGDASAGQAYFASKCSGCHSASGDLSGIGARMSSPMQLQNYWVGGGGGGRGAAATPATVTVTLPSGQKFEGRIGNINGVFLGRIDDFIVTLIDADGVSRSFRRDGDIPKVEIHDPREAHRKLLTTYTDKDIHDVTAYLATLK